MRSRCFLGVCATAVGIASALGLQAPFALAAWQMPASALEWFLVIVTGITGGLGHYLLAVAHRFAPASTLSPFIYQQILYMCLLGYLVFGDVPRPAVVVGAAIVVASGFYLLMRERRGGAPRRA